MADSAVPAPIGRGELLASGLDVLRRPGARLTVRGDAGIGKTTLLGAFAAAVDLPLRVVSVTASEVERDVGLATVTDLVARMAEELAALPAEVRRHLEILIDPGSGAGNTGPADLDPRLSGAALAVLLRQVASDVPLLVVVDDLHWVDEASYVLLTYAWRRLPAVDVRVLAATRPGQDRRVPDAVVLDVGGIDVASLRGMLATHLGRILTPGLAESVHAAVGGNPMYALETVRLLPPEATAEDVRLPPELVDLVRERVAVLGPTCRTALLDVAVRGSMPLADARDGEALDPAFAGGIVELHRGVVTFAHPLLLRGVLDGAPPAARARAHLRAAEVTSGTLSRARHLAAAGGPPDEERAVLLEQASAVALSRGDASGAADLAAASCTATPTAPGVPLPWGRLATLAQAKRWLGRLPDPLVEDMEQAAATPDQSAVTWLLAAEAEDRDAATGLAHAERAAALVGISPSVRLRAARSCANMGLFLGHPYVDLRAVLDTALDDIGTRRTPVREGGDPLDEDSTELALCLADRALYSRLGGIPVDPDDLRQAEAIQAGRLVTAQDPTTVAALVAMYDDQHDEARTRLEDERRRVPGLPVAADFHLAELECRTGNLRAARALVLEESAVGLDPANFFVLALVSAWEGDAGRCRDEVDRGMVLAEGFGDVMWPLALATALSLLHLGLGDPEAAWQTSADVCERLERRGWAEPSVFPVLPVAIDAAALTGRLDDAGRLLDRLEAQGVALRSRWAAAGALRGRALLAAAAGEPGRGLDLAERSVAAFDRLGLPTEAGRSALAAGRLARRAGQRTRAREHLEGALERLVPRGVEGFAGQVRAELGRLGGRERAGTRLTGSEGRVAELAASGLTNAEIAAAAFVSVKTVEAHLSSVYRKLGVRSRAELAATWSPDA